MRRLFSHTLLWPVPVLSLIHILTRADTRSVGKVITPAKGKPMYIANTTGTSDTDRVSALVRNAIAGIIAAKADGVPNPTVGIANIDGARACEKILKALKENGYDIRLAESARADKGVEMRGNDLLMGTADVVVMDSLTGNLMMKMFSSYTTGGQYEASGYGYGPVSYTHLARGRLALSWTLSRRRSR